MIAICRPIPRTRGSARSSARFARRARTRYCKAIALIAGANSWRGQGALPSFDEKVSADASGADGAPWARHVDEFESVRRATLALFRGLPAEAWSRSGVASDNPFSVRALAYITAGHLVHHLEVLRERYLQDRP